MPAQLSQTMKKLMVYGITVAAFSLFPTCGAKAQTTWTITVDVTSNDDRPHYMVLPDHGGCPNMAKQDPENLHVCAGDTVVWDISTMGKHGLLTIHQYRGFQPGNGIKDKWFRGTEGVSMASVTTDAKDPGKTYEYCLAIYDSKNGAPYQLHAHDPKIIIGGTLFEARVVELQKEFSPLLDEISKDSKESEKARRKAKKIDEEIEKLKKLVEK